MAKKQEDNRDVFEKALDYVVPVAGAYLGARAGMRLGAGKKGLARTRKEMEDAYAAGDRTGDYTDAQRKAGKHWRGENRRTDMGIAGMTAGAVGGMVLQDGNRQKRRK